jgi:hypothetical protein
MPMSLTAFNQRTKNSNKTISNMNKNLLLVSALAGALAAASAQAQVEVVLTGSTAFRSITIDRTASLFDPGYTGVTNNASTGLITYSGTVSNAVPSLGATPVKIRLSFSGSGQGMSDVANSANISVADTPGTNISKVPDVALSDVWPGSATPALSDSLFDQDILGVIPFVWVKNNALTGITNITREQAVLLMTDSGSVTVGTNVINGMPATFLGGNSTNPVYLTGRDSGSGTRITIHRDIGFNLTPLLWATNGSGGYVQTIGYSSGGLERSAIAGGSAVIGYLGEADAAAIAGSATAIAYEGIPFSHTNVAVGMYPLWGYEHIVNRAGALSPSQGAILTALKAAMANPGFQSTNTLYTLNFVSLSDMKVQRNDDGGPISPK